MYVAKNKVRMHDTDMAGVIFFAKQFRYVHDALEDLVEHEGLGFDQVFHKEFFVFVIVHAEADYFSPLHVGDLLEIEVTVENIGNSSFSMFYQIFKMPDRALMGTAKTVHVTLDSKTRSKIPIPPQLKQRLQKHLQRESS